MYLELVVNGFSAVMNAWHLTRGAASVWVTASCDLSISTAVRKASPGTLHAVPGAVIQERYGLILESPNESKNNEILENLA